MKRRKDGCRRGADSYRVFHRHNLLVCGSLHVAAAEHVKPALSQGATPPDRQQTLVIQPCRGIEFSSHLFTLSTPKACVRRSALFRKHTRQITRSPWIGGFSSTPKRPKIRPRASTSSWARSHNIPKTSPEISLSSSPSRALSTCYTRTSSWLASEGILAGFYEIWRYVSRAWVTRSIMSAICLANPKIVDRLPVRFRVPRHTRKSGRILVRI